MPANNHLLQKAIQHLQRQQYQQGLALCEQLLQKDPDNPDGLHIKALLAKQTKQFELAEQCFTASLNTNPRQPSVWANLANMLKSLHRNEEAKQHYQKALDLSYLDPNPIKNFALLLFEEGDYIVAEDILLKGIKHHPKDISIHTLLADCYRHSGKYQLAIEHYNKIIFSAPDNINALNNRAIVYRQLQLPALAIKDLKHVLALQPKLSQAWFSLGCAYYDDDNFDQAEQSLLQAIQLQPAFVEAHEAINKLYWEQNHQQEFLQSYQQALSTQPFNDSLWYSFVAQQIGANDLDNAEHTIKKALQTCQKRHPFEHALAVIKSKKGNIGEASNLLEKALQQQPDNIRYLIDLANFHIKNDDIYKASNLLDIALQLAPQNQEVWAYRGLCWRLSGDSRYSWLNNYKQFVYSQILPTPSGYSTLSSFLTELKNAVADRHKNQKQPLDQSVQGGTQTVGNLLLSPTPVIQAFRQSLNQVIEQYLGSLPKDQSHPFLRRNTGRFSVTGSWSVKLNTGGFHTNHVHPLGWLSACTYLNVPEIINSNDNEHQGWIKFGETSLQLGDKEHIEKNLCPQEGLCVLFPAMFWHGTHPFQSNQARITIPCDIMPA